jgi:transcriptional regulator with XRE-family HTH domain
MRDYYYEIGQRIAQMRRAHNITQQAFAELLGVSVKHCSAVERGLSTYSLEKLIDVADYFDCTMDFLLRGINPADLSNQLPGTVLEIIHSDDTQEKSLLREYMQMYAKLRNKSDRCCLSSDEA